MAMTDIHADDYALTFRTSQEMIELMREGMLDSISIVPNMSCYDRCMEMLKEAVPELPFLPLMSVHLDIVEGRFLSDNDGSLIGATWKSLFLDSFQPWRRQSVKSRIKRELDAQIRRTWKSVEECISIAAANGVACGQKSLRIDSHQHTHMIPVVWSALVEVLQENEYEVEYIRNSKEPFIPFIRAASLWGSYRPVNFVKNRLLWFFSHKADRFDKIAGHEPMYLWGLVMSGRMDAQRIEKLYPSMCDYAKSKGRRLEILFHPGRMGDDEVSPEIPQWAAKDFYLSLGREVEKEGLRLCRSLTNQ